ncbi:hypothetical protein VTN31DRAFT_623 [Thermomyces dupontii]|uniref:uncharacterized protein n=1 Tax=Talaromyces thermophilus TaxID=28565 RepID=UPI0037421968
MAPRGLTNPAPKTESARSALSSFTCTLCNKSYSRHPEYEAHIGSYDHQHRKRLQELKQLSRDPNAAERARRAERKADEEAGLVRVTSEAAAGGSSGNNTGKTTAGAGFKKGGFKSSFTTVKGPSVPAATTTTTTTTTTTPAKRKNVLGDDDDEEEEDGGAGAKGGKGESESAQHRDAPPVKATENAESETEDEGYGPDGTGDAYYDPARPTACPDGCPALRRVAVS